MEYVENEVKYIREMCKELKINYYYVNVNTRVTIKFFEYNYSKNSDYKGEHKNPEQGLIVLDQITNKKNSNFLFNLKKLI